jgi:DNA-binding GntR family transcriptional regulator
MASAVPPMGEAALLLGVPVGSPLLSLRRTYFERRGRAIEHSLILCRPDKYEQTVGADPDWAR